MRSQSHFSVIDMHSAGAQARVVIGGVPQSKGSTINEKRLYLSKHHDNLRKILMYEPRGGSQMSGSLIVEPCDPRADIGIIFIESGGWLTMCGAGTIAAATALIESGMFRATGSSTDIVFDTPAGLVTAHVETQDGSVKGVTLENVPSFLAIKDHRVKIDPFGTVDVDIVYGGNFYVIAPAEKFGLEVSPPFAEKLVNAGRLLRSAVNHSISVKHPLEEEIRPIPNVIFTDIGSQPQSHRHLVLFGESGVDRSPGGTGTSARMAQLHARGALKIGETLAYESIISSTFEGKLVGSQTVGEINAVIPQVKGRAFIIALRNFYLDPEDPFQEGFGVGYATDAKRPELASVEKLK